MFVQSEVVRKHPVAQLGKPLSAEGRHEPPPAINGRFVDLELPSDFGLGPEVPDGVRLKHGGRKYLIGNPDATECRGPISNRVLGENARYMRRGAREKPDPIEVGKRIKFLRGARGLSMEQLAQKLVDLGADSTISKSTVSKWESAKTDPTAIESLTTYYLLKILGSTHDFLLFGPDVEATEAEEGAAPLRARR